MKHSLYLSKLMRQAGLVLLLASLMVLLAATGLTLAQTGEGEPSTNGFNGGGAPIWLVLDPAESQEEALPLLLASLADLKRGGHIIAFEPTPQQSAPNAAWAVQVTALAHRHSLLSRLPGVLAAVDQLPPPPPSGQRVQATTPITGRVTQAISPTVPIAGAEVRAYDGVTFLWLNSPGVNTDPAGVYSTTVNSPFNQVKIRFTNPGYTEEWYDNKDTFGTADTIATGGTVITNINAQLDQANAALTGTVTLTPGGTLLDGALVWLYRASDDIIVNGMLTTNGHFTFTSLVSGTYKAEITNGLNPVIIAPEFYQDQPSLAAANLINLTSNTTATIAAEVARTAVITGQVTDAVTMLPITSATHFVSISVYDQNDNFVSSATVDGPTGVYTAAGFGTGSYKLEFSTIGVPAYQTEYYSNALTLDTATLVTVTSGLTRNINEDLFFTGTAGITGQVTSFTGTGLANVNVDLYQLNLANQTYQFNGSDVTDPNGVYTFTNKSNGQYKVRVGHFDNDIIPHAFAWYTNSGTISNATAITVSNGITKTGVNVQLELGGCIAGRILNESGVAQSNAPYSVEDNLGDVVPVFSAGGGASAFFTPSPFSDGNGQGEYLACGLPTGVYTIDCSFGMVSGINVTAGQLTSDIICGGSGNLYLPMIVKP